MKVRRKISTFILSHLGTFTHYHITTFLPSHFYTFLLSYFPSNKIYFTTFAASHKILFPKMNIENGSNDTDVLLLRKKLDLLLRTGKLLMESGANSNRIERNLKRVAAFLGIPEDKLHLDIRWTMLIVNVSDMSHSFSKFQKCEKHHINMTTITRISHLSWEAIENDFTLEAYEEELNNIASTPKNYSHYMIAIGAGFACGGFCKLFGGDWFAFLFTSICACIGLHTRAVCVEKGLNTYFSVALAAFISTCLAYATTYTGLSTTPYHPLLACALFIIPGVPLINFIDDLIDNHLLLGITRSANIFMIISAMTFGISFALSIFSITDINIDEIFSTLSIVGIDSYFVYIVAAAIAAIGFSMIFNIPKRLLWVVGIGGIITVCTRNFISIELGLGPVIGSFTGALCVSLLARTIENKLNVPTTVLTIPSVIPMIPGVLMYRSLLGFASMQGVVGELTYACYSGITAALIVVCISLGVALPNIIARGYGAKNRKDLLDKKLEERRARGNFIEW